MSAPFQDQSTMVDVVPPSMQRVVRGDANPLDELERMLSGAIFGQNRAIESLMRALNRARYNFSAGRSKRPLVNLLFLGPTGVGKSESAKRLARYLHPEGGGFLKIDCSLFAQGHEIAALLGAPPSYVGRDQKPLLDPEIIEKPNSVVLFDEIEKGTPELWNLLLQIMEDGVITLLNSGREVTFNNAIVIMTTNVGAREMVDFMDKRNIGFRSTRGDIEATGRRIHQIGFEALQRKFSPEWINRIDEIITFRPLSSVTMEHIFDRMMAEANQSYEKHGVCVLVAPTARQHILKRGYNPRFGARPIRSRIIKDIEAPLADLLGSGSLQPGSEVLVAYTGETGKDGSELGFFFQYSEKLAEAARITQEAAKTQNDEPMEKEVGSSPPSHGPSMALVAPSEQATSRN
jgi:ATP-dependent Clp protease ATP-binding subunit ClpA